MFERSATRMRTFVLRVGREKSEFFREIKIHARSSLETGMIVTRDDLIPHGYIAHSLLDPSQERAKLTL